jgi:hypothetical protein
MPQTLKDVCSNPILKNYKISYFLISIMAPTNVDLLNKIEELKEMIRQMNPWGENRRDDLIFINQAMNLVNQVMSIALGVPYEPPWLDQSSGMYFE